jgi:holo-[acyl-carrier protein] synthase
VPEPDLRIQVGVDIVGVERIARLASEHLARFDTVFTAAELEYCSRKRRRDDHLAARFAAKEAVLKAVGTGLRKRMQWTDVEVVRDASGRPGVRLHGEVAAIARRKGVTRIDLSLSHSAGLAMAGAIAICSEPTDQEWAA